jgi:N-ethylmaleimide reductase
VELHGAFGYLPHQFLVDGVNQCTDQYGGSLEKRSRFVLEVMQALVDVWGPQRASIKLSPIHPLQQYAQSRPSGSF